MADIDFSERVTLVLAERPWREMPLSDAVREIIAFPQKSDAMRTVIVGAATSIRSYAEVVALYGREDFPLEKPRRRPRRPPRAGRPPGRHPL